MKKFLLVLILVTNLLFSQSNFTKGINLTNWFQSQSAYQIDFSKFSKEDFVYLKSIGCSVIRLPIYFQGMADKTQNYKLDKYLLFLLDEVCDWAEELNISIILDYHPFRKDITDKNIDQVLIPIWQQISEHFNNRSKLIYYEILNEPHGISNFDWNNIQHKVLTEIRKIDSVHTVIVGASNFYGIEDLDSLDNYNDDNIIYTFHFYDPFLFTHQGAEWISPSMENLSHIPFPRDWNRMPKLPSELKRTWVERLYKKYNREGSEEFLKDQINTAIHFAKNRNVKLFCGEFGVLRLYSNNNDRVNWYKFVSEYFNKNNISWAMWDFDGIFGLFNDEGQINFSLLSGLGFLPNEYLVNQKLISEINFPIFSDYSAKGILPVKASKNDNLELTDEDKFEGKYSIKWKDADRYNTITFNFSTEKDFQKLLKQNAELCFSTKFSSPNIKFDVRFVDSKTEQENDHSWRINFTINSSILKLTLNKWNEIKIPLKDFIETGSYDNGKWFNPIGKFNWQNVDKFEFVTEEESLLGKTILLDDIKIQIPK
jgi:endoglucanase